MSGANERLLQWPRVSAHRGETLIPSGDLRWFPPAANRSPTLRPLLLRSCRTTSRLSKAQRNRSAADRAGLSPKPVLPREARLRGAWQAERPGAQAAAAELLYPFVKRRLLCFAYATCKFAHLCGQIVSVKHSQ